MAMSCGTVETLCTAEAMVVMSMELDILKTGRL
jgi:hypothetical protein